MRGFFTELIGGAITWLAAQIAETGAAVGSFFLNGISLGVDLLSLVLEYLPIFINVALVVQIGYTTWVGAYNMGPVMSVAQGTYDTLIFLAAPATEKDVYDIPVLGSILDYINNVYLMGENLFLENRQKVYEAAGYNWTQNYTTAETQAYYHYSQQAKFVDPVVMLIMLFYTSVKWGMLANAGFTMITSVLSWYGNTLGRLKPIG